MPELPDFKPHQPQHKPHKPNRPHHRRQKEDKKEKEDEKDAEKDDEPIVDIDHIEKFMQAARETHFPIYYKYEGQYTGESKSRSHSKDIDGSSVSKKIDNVDSVKDRTWSNTHTYERDHTYKSGSSRERSNTDSFGTSVAGSASLDVDLESSTDIVDLTMGEPDDFDMTDDAGEKILFSSIGFLVGKQNVIKGKDGKPIVRRGKGGQLIVNAGEGKKPIVIGGNLGKPGVSGGKGGKLNLIGGKGGKQTVFRGKGGKAITINGKRLPKGGKFVGKAKLPVGKKGIQLNRTQKFGTPLTVTGPQRFGNR